MDDFFYILSTRTRNALLRKGIISVEQLRRVNPSQLLSIRGFGFKSLLEIEKKLKQLENNSNFDIINNLSSRDKEVLYLRYVKKYKLSSIGKKLSISRERVRQICKKWKNIIKVLINKGVLPDKDKKLSKIINAIKEEQ